MGSHGGVCQSAGWEKDYYRTCSSCDHCWLTTSAEGNNSVECDLPKSKLVRNLIHPVEHQLIK